MSPRLFWCVTLLALGLPTATSGWAQQPPPILDTVFPAGGRAGTTVELTINGSQLQGVSTLTCSHAGITFEQLEKNRFRAKIPNNVPPGFYDLRCVGPHGLSSSRTFLVSNLQELVETEPNNSQRDEPQSVPLNSVINGRIDKGGDLDHFRFSARQGQRVVIECWAERVDSTLRAVLEIYNEQGRRLAVNRGYYGIDPLIDFPVPADGDYTIKLFDRSYTGSASHVYRLDIDTGPRVAFAVPAVVQAGKTSHVTLYGWNLLAAVEPQVAGVNGSSSTGPAGDSRHVLAPTSLKRNETGNFDRLDVEIAAPEVADTNLNSLRLRSEQAGIDGFAYQLPGSHAPTMLGLTDVPVLLDSTDNHSPNSAMELYVPCEISGQLNAGDEHDWYSIEAKRGEVLWLEAFGARINSPVDLDISILDATGRVELARYRDEVQNVGRTQFPVNHLDPSGRWVAPQDGRYLIIVRNLIGGLNHDPRRIYRLSIRREVPDFHLAIVPAHNQPAAMNVSRGGRTLADLFAFRNRGATGSIRVSAVNLPEGIACPDVWLGPGVDRVPLVISANRNAPEFTGSIQLQGSLANVGSRPVRGGTIIRAKTPNGLSRLTADIAVAVRNDAPLRITANAHEPRNHHLYGELEVRHSPGSIVDVGVQIERNDLSSAAAVELIGVGLPELIQNQTVTIPAGASKGYLSFYLPPTLPVGTYSFAVEAKTDILVPVKGKEPKTKSITVISNTTTIDVKPAAFIVEIEPNAPKTIQRGKITIIPYRIKRINGFISKVHTELWAPDEVIGLRARGSTSVGQAEAGVLQLIANENAPLGKQPFLRFYGVGTVEDVPIYHGSHFVDLEIVE